MAGYRDGPDTGDEYGPFRNNLRAARGYGCLLAALIGVPMSAVAFLGNVMGDCTPGPGCHDHDLLHIVKDLAIALPIAFVLGASMWLLTALIRGALRPVMPEWLVILLLVALTLGAAWLGFTPAMETFFGLAVPAKP